MDIFALQMRFLLKILTVYLALLAIIPCCAFDQCPEDKQEIALSATQHEQGDDDCGSCSPFFNCEGCSSVSIELQAISFQLQSPEQQSVYTGFIFPFIHSVHYDYWLPPKLS